MDFPVEVVFRSFELDPTAEKDIKESMNEMLAKKYGMSIDQAKANSRNVERMAQEAGLEYNLDTVKLTNTFDAHRVTALAKTQGLMHEMEDRLYRAYFTESKNLGDHDTLVQLAEEVGLNGESVREMLESKAMSAEVRGDEQEAGQLGIRSVPMFVINRKYSLSGAQPTESFVKALQKIQAEAE